MPKIAEYNRNKAVSYARRWAFSRNPKYADFTNMGGDCTNFISQCLYAGSGLMNYTPTTGWYYRSINDRSPSWTGVEYLYKFLTTNKTRAVFAREAAIDEILPGDVIQLGTPDRFYHSLIVVQASSPGSILVNAHTFNADMRPLNTYKYARARFLHILGVYV